jgi:ubiquinone/menaquinone biosynthesis C-methylase UbiE
MNAAMQAPREFDALTLEESRDFRSYHAFLRAARNFSEQHLVGQMHDQYEQAIAARGGRRPADWRDAEELLAPLPQFQLYNFLYRNLQRFKYHRPTVGIFAAVDAQREQLTKGLQTAADSAAADELRLNPALVEPEYFRFVPFHQHTGGVTHDILDGLCYEIGRRTTVPSHADPNGIYRILFDALPKRSYARVLDWGTGHGAALITWQELHPESECHGVDLSAPCLLLAHRRARERGMKLRFSQQDLARLDFPDAHFDLIFFNFMLHELPATETPALLREAARVLKPGGLFAGHEFHLQPGNPFQNVLQRTHAFTNNESYATPWYETPIEQMARAAGFAKANSSGFERLNRTVTRPGKEPISANHWNLYVFER